MGRSGLLREPRSHLDDGVGSSSADSRAKRLINSAREASELPIDAPEVELDRRAKEERGAYLAVGHPIGMTWARSGAPAVSSSATTCGGGASPRSRGSVRRARPRPRRPGPSKVSSAERSARASSRRPARRSRSPNASCVRASDQRSSDCSWRAKVSSNASSSSSSGASRARARRIPRATGLCGSGEDS